MKNFKKIISALIALCMFASLLPAQFALAARGITTDEDVDAYILGRPDSLDAIEAGASGHVWELQEVTGQPYDYSLTIYARNIEANVFYSNVRYNPAEVELVDSAGEVFDRETYEGAAEGWYDFGEIVPGMTTSTASDITGVMDDGGSGGAQIAFQDAINPAYERLILGLAVKQLAAKDKPKWTVASSGAKYSESTLEPGTFLYKTPTDVNCPMFKIYFKRKAGVTKISDTTIRLAYDDVTEVCGGAGQFPNGTTGADAVTSVSEGVYLVGFPKPPAVQVPVSFKVVKSGTNTGIVNAEVKIYTNAECTGDPIKTLTTNGDGTIIDAAHPSDPVKLEGDTTYYFTVSASNYVSSGIKSFYVGTSSPTIEAVELVDQSEMTYDVTIKVLDADTLEPLSEANVYLDNSAAAYSEQTGADGTVKVKLTSGTNNHAVNASKSPYYAQLDRAQSISVAANNNNQVEIRLVPERAMINLPAIKDNKGNPVSNATVTLIKTSGNKTEAWGESMDVKGAALTAQVAVPKNTTFKMNIDVPGYEAQTLYVKLNDSQQAEYFTDPEFKVAFAAENITVLKAEDPFYTVEVEKQSDNETYIAKVYLSNIIGTAGIFGLRYDNSVFSMNNFKLESTDKIKLVEPTTVAEAGKIKLPSEIQSAEADAIGYHLFQWQAVLNAGSESDTTDDSAEVLDTVAAPKTLVGTYTFKLKPGKDETDIVSNAFTIMPYDKTNTASQLLSSYWAGDYAAAYSEAFYDYWRYVDEDNKNTDEDARKALGRLAEEKATQNGFYQVRKFGLGTDNGMADVETKIIYTNFSAAKAAINFIVTSSADNQPLKDAEIKLTDTTGADVATLTTDITGMVNYVVDTSKGNVVYNYTVSCNGYWDHPETGTVQVTVNNQTPPVTVNETVELDEKIYHDPKLVDVNDHPISTSDVVLTGSRYAYNGKDFRFNVKPAPGKKFKDGTTTPVSLSVTVNKGKADARTYTLTTNDGTAESPINPLTFDKDNNVFVLKGDYIKGDKTGAADLNGFPSDDIIITVTNLEVETVDEKYVVDALAGTHGKIEYTFETSNNELDKDAASTDTNVKVVDIPRNGKTGTFKFIHDDASAGYFVEKVIINGVEIFNDHDNPTSVKKTEFEYQFTDITMDNNIVVTFWDTFNPSKDSIVTLVVGDNGTVDTSAPAPAVTGIKNTRKVFLNPTSAIEFTATPDGGYEMNKVEKEVSGTTGKTEVILADGKYTVAAEEGKEVTAYVTFKVNGAQDTSTVFVTSYVAEGNGTIAPIGVLIYNKFDSPVFTLTALDPGSQASAVRIDGKDTAVTRGDTATYTLVSVEKDTSVGAVFSESVYQIQGIVDYSQGTGTSGIAKSAPVRTPATIVFSRTANGKTTEIYAHDVKLERTGATFQADLPVGTWDVKVSKQGYLDYVITGFEMAKDTKFFGGESAAKAIVMVIGDTTGLGKAITLSDVGTVANGLHRDATSKIRAKADVDDDGITQVGDMSYVLKNYGFRYTKETYTDFSTK